MRYQLISIALAVVNWFIGAVLCDPYMDRWRHRCYIRLPHFLHYIYYGSNKLKKIHLAGFIWQSCLLIIFILVILYGNFFLTDVMSAPKRIALILMGTQFVVPGISIILDTIIGRHRKYKEEQVMRQ